MSASRLVVGIDARELQGRPTGTGRYLRSLLRHWRETDDVFVLFFQGPPPGDPVLRHHNLASRKVGGRGERGLFWQERLLPAAAARERLDVFFSPAYACPLCLDLPRVTTIHDLSFFSHPQDFSPRHALRRRLLTSLSVHASRALLAPSDFTRRELAGRFPSAAGKVTTVPEGPDEDLLPPPPREDARRRLDVSGPYLVSIGAVFNRRCLPELLRAVARLTRRHPRLVLDVVGVNRTHPRRDLRRLVRSLGLARHVRLSGFVNEAGLADRYAAADVAVALSEYEGFGLPALEAASRGVPLVVSRPPSLGEIFAPAALVVPPRDDVAVARAVDRILTEPPLRERLIDAGRVLARGYSWGRAATLTRRVLLRAAGR